MRLLGSVPESLPSHAPGPVCWRLDGILGKSTLELLGDRSSHDDHTEHQEQQAQNSPHLKYYYDTSFAIIILIMEVDYFQLNENFGRALENDDDDDW